VSWPVLLEISYNVLGRVDLGFEFRFDHR
jgi:hypothetical protein